jgi:transposase InsO family protein
VDRSKENYGRGKAIPMNTKALLTRPIMISRFVGKATQVQRMLHLSARFRQLAPNIVNRNFTATAMDQLWTTDITYLDTGKGWLYLTVFSDLFSRRVVGFAIDSHMRTNLVLSALKMAWFRRRPKPGVIVHSEEVANIAVMTS